LLGVRTQVNRFPKEGECHERNRAVRSYAEATGIELVFLVARWPLYTDPGYDGELLAPVGNPAHRDGALDASRMAMSEALAETAAAYRAIGATVVFVTDAPMQRVDVPRTYFRAYRSSRTGWTPCCAVAGAGASGVAPS
jgi:hypothetical protein